MSYVAARGGQEAVAGAEALFHAWFSRLEPDFIRALEEGLPFLLDRVMEEASLYAPRLAALALAQTGGDLYEAVLLLRAYRSTQPRLAYSEVIRPEHILTLRRVSAAFKDIPGGQFLGPTLDYSPRLLILEALARKVNVSHPAGGSVPWTTAPPPVADWLRDSGLLPPLRPPEETSEVPDLTRKPLAFPAPRAMRLQALARADTGGLLALAYANMRGYGPVHPTVAELRLGYAEIRIRHPVTGTVFSIGRIRFGYAEVVARRNQEGESLSLALGFSGAFGWNEIKLISGAILDLAMDLPNPHPAHREEFVLLHTDPVEASGFCIHYKLPHYVMFSSALERLRKVRLSQEIFSGPVEEEP